MQQPKLSELLLNLRNICTLINDHPNFGKFSGNYMADRIEDILFEVDAEVEFVERQEHAEEHKNPCPACIPSP